jgi:hypothetical protein
VPVWEPGRDAREGGEVRKALGVDLAVGPGKGVGGELVEDDDHDGREVTLPHRPVVRATAVTAGDER